MEVAVEWYWYLEAMMEWHDFVEFCIIYMVTVTQEYKL
jgi:hypothetical protein